MTSYYYKLKTTHTLLPCLDLAFISQKCAHFGDRGDLFWPCPLPTILFFVTRPYETKVTWYLTTSSIEKSMS